jgi:hypothetical protein
MTLLGAKVVVQATTLPGPEGPVEIKVVSILDPKTGIVVELPLTEEQAEQFKRDLDGGRVQVATSIPKK